MESLVSRNNYRQPPYGEAWAHAVIATLGESSRVRAVFFLWKDSVMPNNYPLEVCERGLVE